MSRKKGKTIREATEDRLRLVLSESLDSYALVGFLPDGQEITVMHTPNDLHVRAINEAFKAWYDECFCEDEIEAESETEAWMETGEDEE